MKPYQLVVFDCDGVMFDTEAANYAYYNHILTHFGRPPMTESQFDFVHSHTIDQALALLFDGDDEIIRRAYDFRRTIDYDAFLKYLSIEPQLRDLLARIRPPLHTAIATNRTDTMNRLLAAFDLTDQFDLVVTSLDVAHPKPHPEPLHKILNHFHLSAAQALYVGDSEVDAQASHAAGVPFAAYRNLSLTAAYHIDSLREIEVITKASAVGA